MCRLMEDSADSMNCPESFIATRNINELDVFEEHARNMNERWIWKPDSGTQGADMLISSNITELASHATENLDLESKFVFCNGKGRKLS